MLKQLPSDILLHHIFPKMELPQILALTDLELTLVPHTKKYLVEWAKKLGMKDVVDHREFLEALRIKMDVVDECYSKITNSSLSKSF